MLEEARYTQTGSAKDTESISSNAKRPEHELDHLSPPSAEVKKEWMLTSFAPVGLQGLHREIFYFTFDIWRSSQHIQDEEAPWCGERVQLS
jgi:hypothetical protein